MDPYLDFVLYDPEYELDHVFMCRGQQKYVKIGKNRDYWRVMHF